MHDEPDHQPGEAPHGYAIFAWVALLCVVGAAALVRAVL